MVTDNTPSYVNPYTTLYVLLEYHSHDSTNARTLTAPPPSSPHRKRQEAPVLDTRTTFYRGGRPENHLHFKHYATLICLTKSRKYGAKHHQHSMNPAWIAMCRLGVQHNCSRYFQLAGLWPALQNGERKATSKMPAGRYVHFLTHVTYVYPTYQLLSN